MAVECLGDLAQERDAGSTREWQRFSRTRAAPAVQDQADSVTNNIRAVALKVPSAVTTLAGGTGSAIRRHRHQSRHPLPAVAPLSRGESSRALRRRERRADSADGDAVSSFGRRAHLAYHGVHAPVRSHLRVKRCSLTVPSSTPCPVVGPHCGFGVQHGAFCAHLLRSFLPRCPQSPPAYHMP